MFDLSYHSQNDAAHLPSCAEQLEDLAETLPAYIEHTVLPELSDEVAFCAADLNQQVDGTRQLLLQSAVLRRSALLAPLMKQQLVRNASQLQRRRAQLVQVLQNYVKRWGPSSARGVSNNHPSGSYDTISASTELSAVWQALQAEMDSEEKLAHIVAAPLCASAETLREFLAEAVHQHGLHRKVLAQVEGGKAPHRTPSPLAPPSPAQDGVAQGGDAIEEALQLLLQHIRRQSHSKKAVRDSETKTAMGGGKHFSSQTGSSPSGAAERGEKESRSGDGICNVDGDSDTDVEALLLLSAEEDVVSPNTDTNLATDKEVAPARGQSASATTKDFPPAPSTPWLVVPGIVSLRQYCADLPWVADLAEQRYAEARERKKHSGGSGPNGGGEIGYFSRHVQPQEKEAKEKASAGSRRQQAQQEHAALLFSTLGPVGGFFAPSLALGAAEETPSPLTGPGSAASSSTSPVRGESAAARALRHAGAASAGDSAKSTSSYTWSREAAFSFPPSSSFPSGGSGEGALDERVSVARAVVQCLAPAVDQAWSTVEEHVVVPFCAAPSSSRADLSTPSNEAHAGKATTATTAAAEKEDDVVIVEVRGDVDDGDSASDQEEAVSAFLEVMKARYMTELAAQVVAARQAMELLLDSEDSVIFDGARLQSLTFNAPLAEPLAGLPETDKNDSGNEANGATFQKGHGEGGGRDTSASGAASAVLSCTVLTMPGLEEIFYVVAYCAGAAMLRDAAAATRLRTGTGDVVSRAQLVIDVDAQGENVDVVDGARSPVDLTDEEDATGQQLALLQVWAAKFEKRFLPTTSQKLSSSAFRVPSASMDEPLSRQHHHHSLSPLFRLWLYLWEFVFSVPTPQPAALDATAAETSPDTSSKAADNVKTSTSLSGSRSRAGAPSQLFVSLRTARRWMERVMAASVRHGCVECGVLRGPVLPSSPPLCLPRSWSAAEADRVVRLTTTQARQALLSAAGVDLSAAADGTA